MEWRLDIRDGNAHESTRLDIIERLEHDSYRVGFRNYKSCSADLIVEGLLGRKTNTSE